MTRLRLSSYRGQSARLKRHPILITSVIAVAMPGVAAGLVHARYRHNCRKPGTTPSSNGCSAWPGAEEAEE